MLGFALFILAARHLHRRPGLVTMVVNAALAVFLALVHGRFAGLPIICLGLLAYIGFSRRDLLLPAAVTGAALVVVWGLGQELQRTVHRARWDAGVAASSLSLHSFFRSVPGDLFRALAGETWYVLIGTAGLALLGVAALIRGFLSTSGAGGLPGPRPLDGRIMLAYTLAAVLSVFLISSMFVATGLIGNRGQQIDYVAYGRYADAFVPTLIALGTGLLLVPLRRRGNAKLLAVGAAAILASGFLIEALAAHRGLPLSASVVRIPGVFGIVAHGGRLYSPHSVVIATLGASVVVLLLSVLSGRHRGITCGCILLIFLVIGVQDVRAVRPVARQAASSVPAYNRLAALHPTRVAYDLDSYTVLGYYGFPFWLNHAHFVEFHNSDKVWPDAQMYIGPPRWPQATAHGLHRLQVDKPSGQGVWVP
jgi:hypothetical protein